MQYSKIIANFAVGAGHSGKKAPEMVGVASPCISWCEMDASTDLCLGCARTIDEITAWSTMSELAKAALVQQLPARATHREAQGQASATPPAA